jgi:copper chaperone
MLFGKKTEVLSLRVEGMTCGHCEKAVAKALGALPGVKRASANAKEGTATVEVEQGRFDRQAAARAIEEAGYKVKG